MVKIKGGCTSLAVEEATISNTKKENIRREKNGFFFFSSSAKGKVKIGEKKLITFFFDSEEDYSLVLSELTDFNKKYKNYPQMNGIKLVKILKERKEERGK